MNVSLKVFLLIISLNFNYIIILNNIINTKIYQSDFYNGNFISKKKNSIRNTNINYNITNLEYSFSFKYNLIKIKYDIIFYDENRALIKPSDLSLYYNLHILCQIEIIKTGEIIYSIANIYENKNFYCTEYNKIDESITYGIKIYEFHNDIDIYYKIFFLMDTYIDYNNLKHKKNSLFNILLINQKHNQLLNKIKNKGNNYKLKKSFLLPPIGFLKNEIAIINNQWIFSNIFNNYFCFCKGINCIKGNMYQNCKYKIYLTMIDNNRKIYGKTAILLSDFFVPNIEPIDGYPLFKEMLKKKLPVFYMTIDENIYKNFITDDKYSNYDLNKFPIIYEKIINGDFLQRYFELFLRLKFVFVIDNYLSIDNLFYNIEYITYIILGHGDMFFKEYLYNDYRNFTKFDKIMLPPSNIMIRIAKKYGWQKQNIIKICLPRYDKYNSNFNYLSKSNKIISIFLMFTWRVIKEGKKISPLYLNNTIKILTNKKLNKALNDNNSVNIRFSSTLYFLIYVTCYHKL